MDITKCAILYFHIRQSHHVHFVVDYHLRYNLLYIVNILSTGLNSASKSGIFKLVVSIRKLYETWKGDPRDRDGFHMHEVFILFIK